MWHRQRSKVHPVWRGRVARHVMGRAEGGDVVHCAGTGRGAGAVVRSRGQPGLDPGRLGSQPWSVGFTWEQGARWMNIIAPAPASAFSWAAGGCGGWESREVAASDAQTRGDRPDHSVDRVEGHSQMGWGDVSAAQGLPGLGSVRGQARNAGSRLGGQRCDLRGEDLTGEAIWPFVSPPWREPQPQNG